MIERIRCIPVFCPWGLKFYSLSAQCEACYRKCLKLRQACGRKHGLGSGDEPGRFGDRKGKENGRRSARRRLRTSDQMSNWARTP